MNPGTSPGDDAADLPLPRAAAIHDDGLAGDVRRTREQIEDRLGVIGRRAGALQGKLGDIAFEAAFVEFAIPAGTVDHVGRDGITPDQRAIYSAAGPDGFYLACGLSGTGFKTAPAAGVCMSELILDGASKTVDVSSLHFQRFAEGKLIEGEFGYGHIWK
ncbi:MAG TPA: hypothetical protein PKI78_08370 [Anaerolineales bacterium]|nr:hypothetical protein [Anaerolineales bacterium]